MSECPDGPKSLIQIGNCRVSRLIVGHNPPCGHSHRSSQLNQEMTDYFTAENVVKLYQRAEQLGLRTLVIRGDFRMLNWLELYRRQGGRMNVIGQTASEMHDVSANIRIMAAAGAEAIYHHGTQTDRFWREDRIDDCLPYLKCMRDSGTAVGLASHIPEVLQYAEARGWDVDFYLASLYSISRVKRESFIVTADAGAYDRELYLPEDRIKMLATIRELAKPVLAIKILAASRLCDTQQSVREAFRDAYHGIKPTDGVIVGMYPKHFDQVEVDLGYAAEACLAARQANAKY